MIFLLHILLIIVTFLFYCFPLWSCIYDISALSFYFSFLWAKLHFRTIHLLVHILNISLIRCLVVCHFMLWKWSLFNDFLQEDLFYTSIIFNLLVLNINVKYTFSLYMANQLKVNSIYFILFDLMSSLWCF